MKYEKKKLFFYKQKYNKFRRYFHRIDQGLSKKLEKNHISFKTGST